MKSGAKRENKKKEKRNRTDKEQASGQSAPIALTKTALLTRTHHHVVLLCWTPNKILKETFEKRTMNHVNTSVISRRLTKTEWSIASVIKNDGLQCW
jgi:hypothetical protein